MEDTGFVRATGGLFVVRTEINRSIRIDNQLRALNKNGVKVVSATEVISEGAEGTILESVIEG